MSRRERPIFAAGPLGPWQGAVTVTPLRDVGRRELVFEVLAQWVGDPVDPELGEVLDGRAEPRPVTYPHIVDGDAELAERVARMAAEELRRPAVPKLAELERRAAERQAEPLEPVRELRFDPGSPDLEDWDPEPAFPGPDTSFWDPEN